MCSCGQQHKQSYKHTQEYRIHADCFVAHFRPSPPQNKPSQIQSIYKNIHICTLHYIQKCNENTEYIGKRSLVMKQQRDKTFLIGS